MIKNGFSAFCGRAPSSKTKTAATTPLATTRNASTSHAPTSHPSPPSGLRRRRNAAATPLPEATDLEAGVSHATTGAQPRHPRAKAAKDMLLASRKNVPTVTTGTVFFGLLAPVMSVLATNKEHAGPKSLTDLLDWKYPTAREYTQVPPPRDQARATAQREVRTTKAALALPPATTSEATGGEGTPSSGWNVLQTAKRWATAAAQSVGLINRDAVSLADLIKLDTEAQGGVPGKNFVDLAPKMAGLVRAHNSLSTAKYLQSKADQGVSYFAECIKAGEPGREAQIDLCTANYLQSAKNFHMAEARLAKPLVEENPATLQQALDTARDNLTAARDAYLANVGDQWKRPSAPAPADPDAGTLEDMLDLHAQASKSFATATREIEGAKAGIRRAQALTLSEMTTAPFPGPVEDLGARAAGESVALTRITSASGKDREIDVQDRLGLNNGMSTSSTGFAKLSEKLLQRIPANDLKSIAPDQVMALTMQATAAVFGDGAKTGKAATQALEILSRIKQEDLPDIIIRAPDSGAARLAMALGRLPRGAELVSRLCGTSDFLAPRSLDTKEAKAAANKLAKNRAIAFRYFSVASSQLSGPGRAALSDKDLAHLTLARDGARDALRSPTASIRALPKNQRFALSAVRNRFYSLEDGEVFTKADEILKQVSGSMLSSPARTSTLARFDPRNSATPLNPSALSSASKALKQGGLIGESMRETRMLRDAMEDLEPSSPLQIALKTASRAFLTAVDAGRPERVGTLTNADVTLPDHFGLTPEQRTAMPRGQREQVEALWQRYDNSRTPAAGTAGATAGHPTHTDVVSANPGEVLRDLAMLAEKETGNPGVVDAAKAAAAFRAQLDSARVTGIWENPQLDTPEQLAEAMVALFRVMKPRSRMVCQGDKTGGFDADKLSVGRSTDGSSLSDSYRFNAGAKLQVGANFEIGFSTAAFYVIIGKQRGLSGKLGASGALSKEWIASKDDSVNLSSRLIEGGISGSYEDVQQEGLRLLIPRDRSTEAQNLRECEEAVRHMVLWESLGYDGPAKSILTNVEVASLNVMDRNDRQTTKGEASLGMAPLQTTLGIKQAIDDGKDRPAVDAVVQARVGGKIRSTGDVKTSRVIENKSGYYTIEDIRQDHDTQQSSSVSGMATLGVKVRHGEKEVVDDKGKKEKVGESVSVSVSDLASASKEGQLPNVNYATLREVKMDGEILTGASRFTRTTSEIAVYDEIMQDLRPKWITAAAGYTTFPSDFTPDMKMAASERHFDQWMAGLRAQHSQFSEYSSLLSLHDDTGGTLDAINASRELRRNTDGAADIPSQAEKDLLAAKNLILGDLDNWIVRRTSSNLAITHADRPGGHLLGFNYNVGGSAYLNNALELFPPP